LIVLRWIMGLFHASTAAASLSGWISFLGFILTILLIVLALRWFRNHVMWSVRNRLIVTYLFIGGVPVTLAIVLALGTGDVAAALLDTFRSISAMQGQVQRLSPSNAAAAEEIFRHHVTPERIMASETVFPARTVAVLRDGAAPKWLKDGSAGLVSDRGELSLRAANSITAAAGPEMVVSTVSFDQKFLG